MSRSLNMLVINLGTALSWRTADEMVNTRKSGRGSDIDAMSNVSKHARKSLRDLVLSSSRWVNKK